MDNYNKIGLSQLKLDQISDYWHDVMISDLQLEVSLASGNLTTYINDVSGILSTDLFNATGNLIYRIDAVSGRLDLASGTLYSRINTASGTLATSISDVSGALYYQITGASGLLDGRIDALESQSGNISGAISQLNGFMRFSGESFPLVSGDWSGVSYNFLSTLPHVPTILLATIGNSGASMDSLFLTPSGYDTTTLTYHLNLPVPDDDYYCNLIFDV